MFARLSSESGCVAFPQSVTVGSSSLFFLFFFLRRQKTKVIKNNLNPKWGETLSFTLSSALSGSSVLTLRIYHAAKIGKHKV
jgi:Ca2+-dependent lipid-binding protein